MAIHVQDEEADWLVRDFARRRGIGITAAIKLAVKEASANEHQGVEALKHQLEPIWKQIRARRRQPVHLKDVRDEMWGENA